MAEGDLRAQLERAGVSERVSVDSAGTDVGRPGRKPDPRARRSAARRGVWIGELRARSIERADLDRFDKIVVFDRSNLDDVLELANGTSAAGKVALLLGYRDREIADPVAGSQADFECAFDEIHKGCAHLFERLQVELSPAGAEVLNR